MIRPDEIVCPACGAAMVERRQRLACSARCGYEEGCCEGGPCHEPEPEDRRPDAQES